MKIRSMFAIATLGLGFAAPAQAEIVLGGVSYPDSDFASLQESCRGLEGQARQSLTSDVPDDVDNGNAGGAYQLKQLPFTVRDCRAAGFN